MYAGVLFLTLFLIFLCYMINFSAKNRKKSLPTNWPVLGMMPGLLLNVNRIHDYVTDLLEDSGGTFLFKGPWFTNMEMLLTGDPSNVQYILSKNFHNFSKGPEFKKIFDVLGDGIFAAEFESWENQRKILTSLIRNSKFQNFVGLTTWNKVESGLIPILEEKTGIELDLQEIFQRFAFDCSCILVLGHDPNSLSIEFPHLPHEKAFVYAEEAILQRHILQESLWKLQKWIGIGKEGKLSKSKEILDQFLYQCISLKLKKLKEMEDNYYDDLLTGYYYTQKSDICEEAWRDIMLNLLTAGKDTISSALIWFFYLIAKHPEEARRIRKEILTLNIDLNTFGKNSEFSELKRMTYLHAALCESLRLFPPIALQHKAPMESDVLPSGHRVGTNIRTLLSLYSMGRMRSIWGEDCLEFKPERWINPETGGVKNEPSFKFAAFNMGPRSCLGKEMSFIQMKIVAAVVVSRFQVQVVDDHRRPVSPGASVVLHMKHGLKVKVSKL